MQKIKICGIRRAADIEIINKYRPDYIGFIFYKKSKRYIPGADAMELRKKTSAGNKNRWSVCK